MTEFRNEENLWPNTCSPPEFLVRLCQPVYRAVTLCPASSGDAGDMRCLDRLERVPRKIDSPRPPVDVQPLELAFGRS